MAASDAEWWRQACDEVETARVLRGAGRHAGAYHHAGQAVEFALKAIYMRRQNLRRMPDECRGAQWHDLKLIAERAALHRDIATLSRRGAVYESWLIVREWDSNARFPGNKRPRKEMDELVAAVCREQNGIMEWLESVFQP